MVASSEAAAGRLKEHGIPIYELNTISELEFHVDDVDKSNECLGLIKDGGAVLTREKVVAATVKTLICIVDTSKLVPIPGQFSLPVGVVPMARSHITRQLAKFGGDPIYRKDVLTDNGSVISDMHSLRISSPVGLEEEINVVVGVVTSGLFAARSAGLLLLDITDDIKTLKA